MSKNVFKKVGVSIGIVGLTLLPFLALAQTSVPQPIIASPVDIANILNKILNFLGAIVMTISLIMLLYAAILYLTAGSSETLHTKAKSVLLYAIVGIVVAILAFSVQPFLINILGGRF